MKVNFDYWTTLTVLLAALFVFASIVAYQILSVPPGGDLTDQERYGRPTFSSSTMNASSTNFIPHKDYTKGGWGISFAYPENFEVKETKDASGNPTVTLSRDTITVTLGVACIRSLTQVPDSSWENNFTSSEYAVQLDPAAYRGRLVQELGKASANLFVFEQGAGNAKGFGAIACTGGTNRLESQSGRCFTSATNRLDPQNSAYRDLQNYYLNDFLSSLQFNDNFGNVLDCPGLTDQS